ncbi:MAG TPA: histone deacetylase [Blastocatellia bacterium]|jgi:acetoin utilization deacetylase AcuC-like enzyme|nr:histone deacetylase [Blastocatellia bacterium]
MTTALIYDPAYLKHDTGRHPESPLRLKAILAALEGDELLWARAKKLQPIAASDEDITRCHSARLVKQLKSLCERGVAFVDLDTALSSDSFEVARLAAGAAITAVDQVFSGEADNAFAFVRPPGHHATANRAMGFCLLNNAAIGARYAQARYGAERVLIIDWDVHHGNGTQDIFYKDGSVFYFSTHQYPYYPGTGASTERGEGEGEGTTLNIPLAAGSSARSHRQAFTEALKVIERDFPPDLIIISAGFDSRRGDPLGGLMLEDSDFREMTKEVMDIAERFATGRVVSMLEGGYNLETLGETVRTHVTALTS